MIKKIGRRLLFSSIMLVELVDFTSVLKRHKMLAWKGVSSNDGYLKTVRLTSMMRSMTNSVTTVPSSNLQYKESGKIYLDQHKSPSPRYKYTYPIKPSILLLFPLWPCISECHSYSTFLTFFIDILLSTSHLI